MLETFYVEFWYIATGKHASFRIPIKQLTITEVAK